ncbi:hypothetical protein ABIC03_001487 [Bradyrhizobium sp. RT6a]
MATLKPLACLMGSSIGARKKRVANATFVTPGRA